MEEEQINKSDEWLDEVDEMTVNFKRNVHFWLKEINEDDNDRYLKDSSKTKGHSSRSSKRSSKVNSSGSSEWDWIKGKVKIAELLA